MKTILVFGNPLVKGDTLAVDLIPELAREFPKIKFLHIDPTENISDYGPNLTIIDVIKGPTKPLVITNLDELRTNRITSMHDFDLTYNLKLLIQINRITSIKIYALPCDMQKDEAFLWLKRIIAE